MPNSRIGEQFLTLHYRADSSVNFAVCAAVNRKDRELAEFLVVAKICRTCQLIIEGYAHGRFT